MPDSATLVQALCAAFCAILCALSSLGGGGMMIGARTAAWAKSGYTAKDYVQDGLVAMWDGIENAGWGIHDPNATMWKDLVGGNDLTLIESRTAENVGHWTDKSYFSPLKAKGTNGNIFVRHGEISQAFVDCANSARLTAEVCYKTLDEYSNNPGFFRAYESSPLQEVILVWAYQFSFRGVAWNDNATRGVLNLTKGKFSSSSYRSYGLDSYAEAYNSASGISQAKTAVTSSSSPSMSTDGYVLINCVTGDIHPDSLQGDMYCTRLYNRLLSDAEIAANYAIDKARFDLP